MTNLGGPRGVGVGVKRRDAEVAAANLSKNFG